MQIRLEDVAKRYRYDWIFRSINYTFEQGEQYAVLGSNGAGKSTFLKILSGHLTPSKGKIIFSHQGKELEIDRVYKHVSYAAPYIELIEELSLTEALTFHQQFKPFLHNLSPQVLIEILGFEQSKNKVVKDFSSGMKQRLKLVLAICSDTPILLLDEPTSNLDIQGINWYLDLIKKYTSNRLTIVASNVEVDYQFCSHHLDIRDYKKRDENNDSSLKKN